MKKKPPRNAALRASYKWHRRIGLWLSLPLLVLIITGLLLNHAQLFKLDSFRIRSSILLDWYGMEPKEEPLALRSGNFWAATLDGSLYLNGKNIESDSDTLRCLLEMDQILLLCTQTKIHLFDAKNVELLETLGSESLPPGSIEAAAVRDNELLVKTSEGVFISDAEFVGFEPKDGESVKSPEYRTLSESEYRTVLEDWRGSGITLARFIRDIHSGRIAGAIGVAVIDISGIALLFLIATGLYNFWKLS